MLTQVLLPSCPYIAPEALIHVDYSGEPNHPNVSICQDLCKLNNLPGFACLLELGQENFCGQSHLWRMIFKAAVDGFFFLILTLIKKMWDILDSDCLEMV